MLRRSQRLQSNGYYGQGEPLISYKETLHRVSKRRRPRPIPDNIDQDTVEYNTVDCDTVDYNYDDRDTVDYTTDDFIDYSSGSSRGLFRAIKALGLLVLMLALCFGLIFSIGGLKMDFSTPFMSEYLMNRHEQVERKVQELQRELMDLRKRIDFLLPVGDRMPNFALEELGWIEAVGAYIDTRKTTLCKLKSRYSGSSTHAPSSVLEFCGFPGTFNN
ncbi:uncharacterized protein LOC113028878 [Astatotilapia calliptera]|uniref:uncharacterized protein LOC113015696 n=1 Tax=Astatotilapia calliptera TaxID=8154 RepID=UPI000E40220A|nr:uncharacterized protein LOC113015696 [Astatotilapia calliptera]XP_026035137.1 uncharacterized protein LOC113028878 [Astatotilapia calliptera]